VSRVGGGKRRNDQCPMTNVQNSIASIASWRLCVKCGRDGGTSRRVERARFWAGQSLRPAFARRLPPSLGSYGGTSRRARQSGGPAFAGKLRPGKQSVWNGLERSKSNFFDMWANWRIMSHINLRRIFGRKAVLYNLCLFVAVPGPGYFSVLRGSARYCVGIFRENWASRIPPEH